MMKLFFGILALFLVCPFATSQTPTGGGGGGGGGGIPIPPVPKKAISAVYQGKCGLGQILDKVGMPDSNETATKLAKIFKAHMNNIITSCKECKLTQPDFAKFIAPQTKPGRRSLLQQMLKTASNGGGGGVMPSNIPNISRKFIPSAPCNCDVKQLSNVSTPCSAVRSLRM